MAIRTSKKDEPAEAPAPPALRETPVLEGDELARARAWIEDKVVRGVRDRGYCSEAIAVMQRGLGEPLDTVGVYDARGVYNYGGSEASGKLYPAFLDSDGKDAWGNVWRDLTTKLDRHGRDKYGYDKDGYDKDGYDKDRYNREGFDANGVHKNDPIRFTYDSSGYNAEGYNANGYDREGYNREGVHRNKMRQRNPRFVFDQNGYDVEGYNSDGYNRAGEFSREAQNRHVAYTRI